MCLTPQFRPVTTYRAREQPSHDLLDRVAPKFLIRVAPTAMEAPSFETRLSVPVMAIPLLILFIESLDVRFAVRIEELLAAFLPRRFEFGRCDVPVRPAFLGNGT